jgi:phospholipase C
MSHERIDGPTEQAQTASPLTQIQHIVVLMLENRSFDNLLGWLYEKDGPPRGQHFDGLHPQLWNPLGNFDSDGNAFTERVGVRKNGAAYTLGRRRVQAIVDYKLPRPDPGEGYRDTNYQLFAHYNVDDIYPPEPLAQGFVDNYARAMLYGSYSFQDAPTDPREIMTCYTPEQTPVLSALARQFAVCDRWYAAVPSQTLPNRDFIHAATSSGYVNNKPDDLCDVRTIYNQLQDAIDAGRKDLSWRIYSGTQLDRHSNQWLPFSLTRLTMTRLHDERFDGNFRSMHEFMKDASAGALPSYCFLEPQFSGPGQNDQHPPADIRPGEQLIADVYDAVLRSPAWEKTLLVITYDEHGGCYDHAPPTATATIPDAASNPGQFGFRFNRFGVRVPTVVVSPLIEAGTIGRPRGYVPFDHTSVLRTVQNCFGLHGSLTARDAAAPDLGCLLTLREARSDKPAVKPLAYEANDAPPPNDLHRLAAAMLAKLTGRPTPGDDEIHAFIHDAYRAALRR